MRILLIAGHGEGDPGAVGSGKKESDLTRELVPLIVSYLSADVDIYPTNKNCYKQVRAGNPPDWKGYDYVLEIHFNAFNGVAGGTEVLVHSNQSDTEAAKKIAAGIAKVGFINRGVKKRVDLLNMNQCQKAGVNYALVETCFIDNASNMKIYEANKNKVAQAIASAFPEGIQTPQPQSLYKVQVGAFQEFTNATKLMEKLKSEGYDAIIKKE